MLEWLKNQTGWAHGPATQDGETLIHAGARQIYERLDLASPTNALRERGFRFGPGNPAYGVFDVRDPALPESRLVFEVTAAVPGWRYAYRILRYAGEAEAPVSESERTYTIEPGQDGGHLLHLTETCMLDRDLSREAYVLARAQLNFRVFRNLARLKLHIELGAEAVSTGS